MPSETVKVCGRTGARGDLWRTSRSLVAPSARSTACRGRADLHASLIEAVTASRRAGAVRERPHRAPPTSGCSWTR